MSITNIEDSAEAARDVAELAKVAILGPSVPGEVGDSGIMGVLVH